MEIKILPQRLNLAQNFKVPVTNNLILTGVLHFLFFFFLLHSSPPLTVISISTFSPHLSFSFSLSHPHHCHTLLPLLATVQASLIFATLTRRSLSLSGLFLRHLSLPLSGRGYLSLCHDPTRIVTDA